MSSGATEIAVQVSLGAVLLHVTVFSATVTGSVGVVVFPCSCSKMALIGPAVVVVVSLVILMVWVTAGGADP